MRDSSLFPQRKGPGMTGAFACSRGIAIQLKVNFAPTVK